MKKLGAPAKPMGIKKEPYATKLAPDLIKKLRGHELPAAKIIDRALRDWFAR